MIDAATIGYDDIGFFIPAYLGIVYLAHRSQKEDNHCASPCL